MPHILNSCIQKEWSLLVPSGGRGVYQLQNNKSTASRVAYEVWLLSCALYAAISTQLPFLDLVRLAELFPFRFKATTDHLLNGHCLISISEVVGQRW